MAMTDASGDLHEMSAAAMARAIREGENTSEEAVRACLDRIAAREETVQAWTYLNPDYAVEQARAADLARQAGKPLGPLHGVPVGVKDIIDTADMPTENGTILHAGRRPTRDATVTALLRRAGAVVVGKTVTTELAVYNPGKTRNPNDPTRTPGGSSSGSAAAVAAAMVPLAVGSQTNGSMIRPASYCGVCGYKPSHGLISRRGVLGQSRLLDHVGLFARTVEDLALAAEPLMAFDAGDPDLRPQAPPELTRIAVAAPPVPPRLAFVRTPVWPQLEPDAVEAFDELVAALDGHIEEVPLPQPFEEALDLHKIILETDLAVSFAPEYQRGADRLSPVLREMIERGQRYPAADYNRVVARAAALSGLLAGVLDLYDAILTPATTGQAPVGLQSTGSPAFCTIWTLCGVPAVSLPLLQGGAGMPIGAQLVGARGDDARLLRTARWLANLVGA